MNDVANDATSYREHLSIEAMLASPLDRTPPYMKYLVSAWPYYRARLGAPGRAYDIEDSGMLAIGGSAHCDLLDFEVWLSRQNGATKQEVYKWTMDSSPETIAYWRGFGRGHSPRSIRRERDRIATSASEALSASNAENVDQV